MNMTEVSSEINGKLVRTQQFENGALVNIMRSKETGQRYARVNQIGGFVRVPLELLSLAAGKDAWMREIVFACPECKQRHPAHAMEGEYCQDCYAKDLD
jgi:hypothetical protein